MVHKLAVIAVIGLSASAVCMGAAAAIGGREFGKDFEGMDFSMFGDRPRFWHPGPHWSVLRLRKALSAGSHIFG